MFGVDPISLCFWMPDWRFLVDPFVLEFDPAGLKMNPATDAQIVQTMFIAGTS